MGDTKSTNMKSSESTVMKSAECKASGGCKLFSGNCIFRECCKNISHETIFWTSYMILGLIILTAQFVIIPVTIQMAFYTFPIIYVGAHLSLQQKEINPETGEKQIKTESMSHNDAMLFPFIGSACLFGLYIAYKFLPAYWVNLLLTTYLSIFGCLAVGETLHTIVEKLTPSSWSSEAFSYKYQPSASLEKWIGVIDINLTFRNVVSYVGGFAIVFLWLITKHWSFHNMFAIGFCLQGIRMVSLGNFKVSVILLCGLFVYDIFWVFGTDVMVTVAKAFDAPAKIIFPLSRNPWKQSILGLGDIVLPGIFIAMVLRFDHHLSSESKQDKKNDDNQNFSIHQGFSKMYFWYNLISYQVGMLVTGFIMLLTKHPQPALLYLVPACLFGLFIPAWYHGQLGELLSYTEETPEKPEEPAVDPATKKDQ